MKLCLAGCVRVWSYQLLPVVPCMAGLAFAELFVAVSGSFSSAMVRAASTLLLVVQLLCLRACCVS